MRALSLGLLAAVVAVSATAQPKEVRRGPIPAWAQPSPLLAVPADVSGPMFIRRQDIHVHLDDQGRAQYLGLRVKLLASSALSLGNVVVEWQSSSPPPMVHGIKLYRDGQATDVLAQASFEVMRREDQLEAAMLDGKLTAVLRVPDLRVGDELEVDVTTFERDPTLVQQETGILALPPIPPLGRFDLALSWDRGHEPQLKMTSDMAPALRKGDRRVQFRFDNPPALPAPNDAPARYQWRRVLEYSDFTDWAALSRRFAPLYGRAATLPANSAVNREASRIAAAHPGSRERAAAALKLVQQDVRYVYVGLDGGNLTPASADETWQRRYGDCKGKTALLLALLRELGIEAEPVLVNSSGADDGIDQRLAIPQLFNHVLVRARIAGKDYWLDGTLPPVALLSAAPVFPVRWALPLDSAGRSLERLAWQPSPTPDEITLFEFDARAGFDKPARIVSTTIIRGVDGLKQYQKLAAVSAGQLTDAIRQKAIGNVWQTVDDVEWRYDQAAAASILTISGTGTIDWENNGDGERSLALPGGGFNPPQRRVRSAEQDQTVPFYTKPEYSCHVTTVRVPTSTQPRQWSAKPSFNTRMFGRQYYRAWELRDGAIRMVRGSRVEQPEIDPATAQRDNARIAAFDNSMGWISYDPANTKGSVGRGEKVPATYEMDWTANTVPCLPSN